MIPAWSRSTIGEEFDVQLGKRLDAAVNRGELKLCINNRGVRWGRVEVEQAVWAPLTKADISELRLLAGDVLVCEGGEIGRASVWKAEVPEAYFLNTLHRLRSRGRYNPYLLVAFLERWAKTGELLALVGKSSLAHLTKENLLRVPLPMPCPDEQASIAKTLGSVDDLIVSLERLIAKKRDTTRGIMQELLTGQTRVSGFAGEWREVQLGQVLRVRHGKNQKAVEDPMGRIPILATGGQIGWANTALYSRPSVLIGRKGTIDRPQYQDRPFWTVDTLFYTEISAAADARYLYYVFTMIDWRSMNEASGVPSLSSSRIEGLAIRLPELEEQRAIRAVLDHANAESAALTRRLESARAIKTGMMQVLLAGRAGLRVEAGT